MVFNASFTEYSKFLLEGICIRPFSWSFSHFLEKNTDRNFNFIVLFSKNRHRIEPIIILGFYRELPTAS